MTEVFTKLRATYPFNTEQLRQGSRARPAKLTPAYYAPFELRSKRSVRIIVVCINHSLVMDVGRRVRNLSYGCTSGLDREAIDNDPLTQTILNRLPAELEGGEVVG